MCRVRPLYYGPKIGDKKSVTFWTGDFVDERKGLYNCLNGEDLNYRQNKDIRLINSVTRTTFKRETI